MSSENKTIIHTYSIVAISLILANVWLLAVSEAAPDLLTPYQAYLDFFEYIVLAVFSIEYVLRVTLAKNRLNYIFSYDGIIDLVSILPSLLGFAFSSGYNTSWARVLRLVRLTRVLKALKYHSWLHSIAGQVLPYVIFVFGLEAFTLIAEAKGYWKTPTDLNISLGVVGFSVAVMLGAKLSVVSARIYSIEDSICRVVGSMRDMWVVDGLKKALIEWSIYLENYITSPQERRIAMAPTMRDKTDNLEYIMELNAVGGPNSAGFHRDAAFIIHRATATIPAAYEKFLKTVITFYMFVIIISVSGLSGLLASLLSVLILGGLYFLIEDMDDPLSFREESLIDARIDALTYWNNSHSTFTSESDALTDNIMNKKEVNCD